MNQQQIDEMSESLRAQGLTWAQTNFAVSLVRNGRAAERERCAKACESLAQQYKDAPGSHALERAANAIRKA